MTRIALALATFGLAACTPAANVRLTPQVQNGPGDHNRATRVLSLPASCGSVDFECPESYVATVNGIVRSTMDFAGYKLVEASTLRNETRDRAEQHEREVTENEGESASTTVHPLGFDEHHQSASHSRTTHTKSTTVLTGSNFEDLSVNDRKKVLTDAGADSVLTVRIVVGAQVGSWGPNQNVEVMVKLGVDGGDVMAWASRCMASSNDFETVNAALENAARCAVYGGTGR